MNRSLITEAEPLDAEADGPAAEPLLRTERVYKTYDDGDVHALVNVNLRIDPGEYVAIMGPSGSGKSTFLNILGALDTPSTGEVYFEGQPLSRMPNLDKFRAQKVGFVFQSFYLLPVLRAIENVQVPMFETSMGAGEREEKALELLDTVGLSHRRNHVPHSLSVGERQRVAIARALANDPAILLADEPTGNLDSTSAEGIFELFARLHRERGMTIVLITHDDELGRRAHRLVRMRDGHVISDEMVPHP